MFTMAFITIDAIVVVTTDIHSVWRAGYLVDVVAVTNTVTVVVCVRMQGLACVCRA